ncbi:hypothetical protein [Butyrivibrio sp. WCD2001]|uniref:hypothetical protein n=1 Tax=Butyrivibrio sp. WCD2001 TaxID=1280681 RepID=UPI0003FBAEC9|nr:hypothetical protein [Butyrivibrio sp. WCD2001]
MSKGRSSQRRQRCFTGAKAKVLRFSLRGEISRAAHASPDGITIKKSSTAAANFSPKPRDATLRKAGGMPAFFSGGKNRHAIM